MLQNIMKMNIRRNMLTEGEIKSLLDPPKKKKRIDCCLVKSKASLSTFHYQSSKFQVICDMPLY